MFTRFIEGKIKQLESGRQKCTTKPTLDSFESILLLFNAVDVRHIQKVKTNFLKQGKQVHLVAIDLTGMGLGHSQGTVIDRSDITFWGFPRKTILKTFTKIKPDLVVDFSREYSPILTYLMVNNQEAVRIGFSKSNNSYYDFVCNISYQEHVDILAKSLFRFLVENP